MKRIGLAAIVVVPLGVVCWLMFRDSGDYGAPLDERRSLRELRRDAGPAAPRRRAAEVPADEPANDPEPWEILVLGRSGAPLAGVTATVAGAEATDHPRTTAADGLVRIGR